MLQIVFCDVPDKTQTPQIISYRSRGISGRYMKMNQMVYYKYFLLHLLLNDKIFRKILGYVPHLNQQYDLQIETVININEIHQLYKLRDSLEDDSLSEEQQNKIVQKLQELSKKIIHNNGFDLLNFLCCIQYDMQQVIDKILVVNEFFLFKEPDSMIKQLQECKSLFVFKHEGKQNIIIYEKFDQQMEFYTTRKKQQYMIIGFIEQQTKNVIKRVKLKDLKDFNRIKHIIYENDGQLVLLSRDNETMVDITNKVKIVKDDDTIPVDYIKYMFLCNV